MFGFFKKQAAAPTSLMSVQEAFEVVTKAIREDDGLYATYQANIAMAFYDECHRRGQKIRISRTTLHDVSNQAAKNFLDLWVK